MPLLLPQQLDNRYSDEWEINPDSWLWTPGTKLFLGGKGNGTTARSSGPGNVTGTLANGATAIRVPAIGRNGYDCTAANAEITCPAAVASGVTSAITISSWVRVPSFVNSTLFGSDRTSLMAGAWCGWTGGSFFFYLDGLVDWSLGVNPLATNSWQHVLATWGSGFAPQVFLNGQLRYQYASALSGSITNHGSPSWAWGHNGAFAINGYLSDPILLSFRATAPQIRQLASRRPDLNGAIRSTIPRYFPTATVPEETTTYSVLPVHTEVESRYNDDEWEIDPDSWLWSPKTKLFWGGKGDGNTFIDSSVHNLVGIASNLEASSRVYSQGRRIVVSDATDNVVTIPSTPILNLAVPCSISIMAKFTTTLNKVVFERNTNFGFSVQQLLGSLALNFGGSTASVSTRTASAWNDGKWHVFTFCMAGTGNSAVYVDGHDDTDSTYNGAGSPVFYSTPPIYYLSRNGSFVADGAFGDLIVYDGILSEPQIRQLASRRPDLNGAIRSTIPRYFPVATGEAPPAVTYKPMQFQVC